MSGAGTLARLYVCALGATAVLGVGCAAVARHLVINCTESMPLGVYWLSRGAIAKRGDLVAFPVPPSVGPLVDERHYLPEGALLLKPVVAASGDRVCTSGGVLSINGAVFGSIASRDSAGRPLPRVAFCGEMARGEIFVASSSPHSFDSRNFGAVHAADLRGRVVPLWTF